MAAMKPPRSVRAPVYISDVASPWDHDPTDATVYSNWVRAASTPCDLSLDFGYRRREGPPQEFPVRVVMSWEHARVLHEIIAVALSDYEEAAGSIRDLGAGIGPAADVLEVAPANEEEEAS